MSDWRIKGVLDRWGSIEWIVFHASHGLTRPTAVLGDYEVTQLRDEMRQQRIDLEALRVKTQGKQAVSGAEPTTR